MTDLEAIASLLKIVVTVEQGISKFVKGIQDEELRRKTEEAIKDRDVSGLNDLLGLSDSGQA